MVKLLFAVLVALLIIGCVSDTTISNTEDEVYDSKTQNTVIEKKESSLADIENASEREGEK